MALTFRQLLQRVQNAYYNNPADAGPDHLLCLFDLSTGAVIEGGVDGMNDTLAAFIAIEIKEVIFGLEPFDENRELTYDEVRTAMQAIGRAQQELEDVESELDRASCDASGGIA